MKVKLDVLERVLLFNLLPKEGNFLTLKTIRQLRERVGLDAKEVKEIKVVNDIEKGTLTWDADKDPHKEIEVNRDANKIIVDVLEKMDKDGKLNDQHISLYEKFVEEKSEETDKENKVIELDKKK
jgi:hypothetical protein